MRSDKLISGTQNISIPFPEYFEGLAGHTVVLSSAREFITIMDEKRKKVATVHLGSAMKKNFSAIHKVEHVPDAEFYGKFGVLMNGFSRKDWLFLYENLK